MKAKWIAGLVAMSLVSAIAAAVLTAVFLLKGYFGVNLPGNGLPTTSQGSASTSGQTTGTIAPTTTLAPTPTKVPTPEPTPTVDPTKQPTFDPDDPNAVETLYLWQTRAWLENIYASVAPAVVGIKIEVNADNSSARQTNEGSGLILDKTGNIVTNANLLNMALDKQGKVLSTAAINVFVMDISQPFAATLIGSDPMTGLAVLKINPDANILKTAKIAGESELKVGQMILSIGYPGLQFESGGLSSGIICGLNRPVALEDGTTLQMIQTDAQISQNCSGGPLLNLNGEVIGLSNSSLARESIDPQSYALPAKTMIAVAQGLIDNGFVSGRSWLGVSVLLEDSFLELQKLYLFPSGLYISNVVKDSPAYTADLRKGDIITKINSKAVGTSMDLGRFLQSQPVGTLVTFTIYRRSDGQYHTLKTYLQEYKQ